MKVIFHTFSKEDSAEGITAYLERNPKCSFLAKDNGSIVGALIVGFSQDKV